VPSDHASFTVRAPIQELGESGPERPAQAKRPTGLLCGFFGSDDAFGDRQAIFGTLQIQAQILQNAVVYVGFGAQNFPFMELLFAFFGFRSLALAVLFQLLRNKPNLGFTLFGSEL
jgi:hypothetical protein